MKTLLVIFGLTGDLSRRKLLPALEHIFDTGDYNEISVVGVSRREINVSELLTSALGSDRLADSFSSITMNLADPSEYIRLRAALTQKGYDQLLFYLSVPPSASADIVDYLGQAGLNTPNVKLLFEKPFGFDYNTAKEFLDRTAQHFTENQIFRIDHYMAKEVALRLVELRQSASTHQHAWSNKTVSMVEVLAAESLDIEGRAVFYEQTGALRDFIQGHLIELLSLVVMPLPKDFSVKALADFRLRALDHIRIANPQDAYRAQYEGYQAEVNNPGSTTETLAEVCLFSDDPNWAGVPLRLMAGKALGSKLSAVVIHYKDGNYEVFDEAFITVDGRKLDSYERVLTEAIAGRKTIFTTGSEVLRSWQILAPIQEAWAFSTEPLVTYKKGSDWRELLAKNRHR